MGAGLTVIRHSTITSRPNRTVDENGKPVYVSNNAWDEAHTIEPGTITNTNIASDAGVAESKLSFNTSTGHTHNGIDSRNIESSSPVVVYRVAINQVPTR